MSTWHEVLWKKERGKIKTVTNKTRSIASYFLLYTTLIVKTEDSEDQRIQNSQFINSDVHRSFKKFNEMCWNKLFLFWKLSFRAYYLVYPFLQKPKAQQGFSQSLFLQPRGWETKRKWPCVPLAKWLCSSGKKIHHASMFDITCGKNW